MRAGAVKGRSLTSLSAYVLAGTLSGMKRVLRNLRRVLLQPRISAEFIDWSLQRVTRRNGPVRRLHGVELGHFNGFSEYHSVVRGVSVAEKAFLQDYAFGPGAIIDVGANLGLFALLMSRRYPARAIHAFEPSPTTFAALRGNLARNRAVNIQAHQVAVTNHDGLVSFSVREHARANSSIHAEGTTGPSIEVRCVTLDSFMAATGVKQIALLKVDVEGYEPAVLDGAARLLARYRPGVIYFEVCHALARDAGFDPADAAHYLVDRGYRLHRLTTAGTLEPVEPAAAHDIVVENWVGVDTW